LLCSNRKLGRFPLSVTFLLSVLDPIKEEFNQLVEDMVDSVDLLSCSGSIASKPSRSGLVSLVSTARQLLQHPPAEGELLEAEFESGCQVRVLLCCLVKILPQQVNGFG